MNDIAITHDGKYAVSICMEQNVTFAQAGDGGSSRSRRLIISCR